MNELEMRRRLYINPRDKQPLKWVGEKKDAQLNRFADEIGQLEDVVEKVVKVPTPEHLPDQLLDSILGSERGYHRRGFRARVLNSIGIANTNITNLSLAAGLCAAIGLGLFWNSFFFTPTNTLLSDSVMAHVHGEIDYLNDDRQVSGRSAAAVVSAVGADLNGQLPGLRYAGLCQINNTTGAHLIMAGALGPVTVLLLPNQDVTGEIPTSDAQFDGMIFPSGRGSVAILGVKGEPLSGILDQVRRRVSWRI